MKNDDEINESSISDLIHYAEDEKRNTFDDEPETDDELDDEITETVDETVSDMEEPVSEEADEEPEDELALEEADEENYSDIKFTMSSDRPTRQSQKYNGSSQELFVENLSFDSNPLERKVINVDVEKLLCNIIVTIEEGNLFKYQYPGKLSINITGSSNAYHVSKNKQSGNRIIIEDNLSYIESRNEYVSKNKVFPASVDSDSGLEDNIIVTILEDDVAKLRVDTDAKAQKGTQIDVVIKPTRQEVIISVDSWQIRKSNVRL